MVQPELQIPIRERTIPDKQFADIVAAVGNNPLKCLTVALMEDRSVFNRGDLNRGLYDIQGGHPAWAISSGVGFEYCAKSLSPIGLVTYETYRNDLGATVEGYALTQLGYDIGVPLAGLLLEFSERHNISLERLFGPTYSNGPAQEVEIPNGVIEHKQRAPDRRMKIIWELLTTGLPIHAKELSDNLHMNMGKISKHLVSLREAGVIEYDETPHGDTQLWYRISPDWIEEQSSSVNPRVGRPAEVGQLIFETLRQHPNQWFSIKDLELLHLQPVNRDKPVSSAGLELALLGLFQKDVVQRKESQGASLTDAQRSLLIELFTTLDAVQRHDPAILTRGRQYAHDIIHNPGRVYRLVEDARKFSSHANSLRPQEAITYIGTILADEPGLTTKEVVKRLNHLDVALSPGRVGDLLKQMHASRLATYTVGHDARHWRLR